MFCTACGTKNQTNSNFCKQCGQRLEKTTAGKINEADFDHALPLEEQINALLERAYRLRKAGDIPGALALCNEILELRPTSTSAHSLLGQLYELSGDRQRAIAAYERVLEINPGSIADRVKLDELRDQTTSSAGSRPHIVLADRNMGRQDSRGMLAVAAYACGLMVLGGAAALFLRTHNDATAHPTQTGGIAIPSANAAAANNRGGPAVGTSSLPGTTDLNLGANVNADSRETGVSGSGGANAPAATVAAKSGKNRLNETARNTVASAPSALAMPTSSFPQGPIYIDRPVYVPVPASAREITSHPSRSVPTMKVTVTPQNKDRGNEDTGDRVMLAGDSANVTNEGNGHIKITVGDRSPKSHSITNVKPDGSSDGKGADNSKISIKVVHKSDPPPNVDTVPPVNAADSESQTMIARGRDMMQTGDYKRAVQAYRGALSAPGDSEGFLYQQIGLCYQRMNNNESAITNYQSAITAYQKQLNAGHEIDKAKNGIRFCRNGIRACGS